MFPFVWGSPEGVVVRQLENRERENGGRGWGAIEFAVCLGARIRRRALS